MNGDARARGGSRAIGGITAIALAVVTILLVSSALLNGPSLDDYWTLYLADASRGLPRLVEERWIQDIRPPLFDGWATGLSMIGLTSIPLARLASNLPALLILIHASRCFARRLPGQRPFHAIFLLLMLSAPATVGAFGVYRGDFWQLAAFSIQIMLARHIMFADKDYRGRTDGAIALLALIATFAAITLDYGGALFGGIVTMATILAALARGFRRWARSLFIMLVLSVTTIVYVISWQAASWTEVFDLYQNWIEMGDATAGGILLTLLFGTIVHNPVALGGGYVARKQWHRDDIGFAILIGAALVASLVVIMQVDAQRRLITASNSADIAVMATALMATAGAKIADRRLWMNALALVAVLSSAVALMVVGLGGAWQTGAKRLARAVQACPATRIYAASGWRIDDGTGSRAARREEPVFASGYRRLGHGNDFAPIILPPAGKTEAAATGCPTFVWIEQVPARKHPKPAAILKAVGLTGLDAAKLTLTRTNSGLLLRADR